MRKCLSLLPALALAAAAAVMAAEVSPDVLVKNTTQEVLAIIKQDKDIRAGQQKKILELIDGKVLPHFNFTRMTRLAVGKNWNRATPEQQQDLVKEFRTLLVRTYSTALTAYKDQTIDVKPLKMQAADSETTVKTQVNQSGAQPVTLDYSMEKTPQGWKVYDVTVGGVSLVTNYRSTFDNQISQSGVDGLIKTLAEKNRAGETGPKTAADKSSDASSAKPDKK